MSLALYPSRVRSSEVLGDTGVTPSNECSATQEYSGIAQDYGHEMLTVSCNRSAHFGESHAYDVESDY